jgi:hypothetical protein
MPAPRLLFSEAAVEFGRRPVLANLRHEESPDSRGCRHAGQAVAGWL